MGRELIHVIDVPPLESWLWLIACALIIIRGRPEIALAINFCTIYWTRNMFLIPGATIAQTWIFMITLALSTLVYMIRDRKIVLTPQYLLSRDQNWLPKTDRWIIVWMLCWWAWIITLLFYFTIRDRDNLVEPTLYYTIYTMPSVLLISWNIDRIKSFALWYIILSLIGVYYALRTIGITIEYLIQDPGLEGIIRLNLLNYQIFARFCVIALIFCLAFFISMRRPVIGLLSLIGSSLMAHSILLAGARQSMSGAVICAALFVIWALRRGGALTSRALIIAGLVIFLGISIYQIAPHLVIREYEDDVSESFNLVEDRGSYWQRGFEIFRGSPVYGSGFVEHEISHNLFVGTLSDQGIVGFVFLIGFLIFASKRFWIAWMSPADTDLATFRMALAAIFIYTIIHSQAAGNSAKLPHLYWPIAMLWTLESSYGVAKARQNQTIPVPTAFVRPTVAATNRALEQ